MNKLNLELADVIAEIHESEKQIEMYDEILKQNDMTSLSDLEELRDLYKKLQDWVKLSLNDLKISEYLLLLAKEPVVGVKVKSEKSNRRKY
jgi:hypothetical protein